VGVFSIFDKITSDGATFHVQLCTCKHGAAHCNAITQRTHAYTYTQTRTHTHTNTHSHTHTHTHTRFQDPKRRHNARTLLQHEWVQLHRRTLRSTWRRGYSFGAKAGRQASEAHENVTTVIKRILASEEEGAEEMRNSQVRAGGEGCVCTCVNVRVRVCVRVRVRVGVGVCVWCARLCQCAHVRV